MIGFEVIEASPERLCVSWGDGTISGDPMWVARQISMQVRADLLEACRPHQQPQD